MFVRRQWEKKKDEKSFGGRRTVMSYRLHHFRIPSVKHKTGSWCILPPAYWLNRGLMWVCALMRCGRKCGAEHDKMEEWNTILGGGSGGYRSGEMQYTVVKEY